MNYQKVTKAELVEYCQALEDQLEEAVKFSKRNSFDAKLESFRNEAVLLGQDILKVVGYVYNLGVTTGKQFHQLVEAYKAKEVKVPFLPNIVNNDVPFLY